MIKACYLPGAHLKIIISLNGHIQSFGLKTVQELDDSIFYVFLAGVIPTQVEKYKKLGTFYRLWFVLDLNQSVFCWCKGGANQGYRHFGATLFKPDNFFFNQRKSLNFVFAYWNPKPRPTHKLVPNSEMQISCSTVRKKKTHHLLWFLD